MKICSLNKASARVQRCAAHANSVNQNSNAIPAVCLALLFLLTLSASGCIGLTGAPNQSSSKQGSSGAAISLVPASVNFGHVAVGSTVSQSITVSNEGQSSLTVTKADTTAAGVRIAGISFPLVLAAGKRSTFEIVYSPKIASVLSGSVLVMSDASSAPSKVTLSGAGAAALPVLTASAGSLNFGDVTLGKSSVLSVTLTNSGNFDVTVSKVTHSGAPFSESGISAGLILAPGQSATLEATFSPTAAGTSAGIVTVASTASNSPETISLSGTGTQSAAHSVVLTWSPSTSLVAGYDVYRSEVSGGPYAKLDPGILKADTYTDSTVQPGFTYYYVVRSVTSAGVESANSMQASATIPAH
jgi:hypothetical protein